MWRVCPMILKRYIEKASLHFPLPPNCLCTLLYLFYSSGIYFVDSLFLLRYLMQFVVKPSRLDSYLFSILSGIHFLKQLQAFLLEVFFFTLQWPSAMLEEAAHCEPGALDRGAQALSSDSSTWAIFTVLNPLSKMRQFLVFIKKLVIEEKKCRRLAFPGCSTKSRLQPSAIPQGTALPLADTGCGPVLLEWNTVAWVIYEEKVYQMVLRSEKSSAR